MSRFILWAVDPPVVATALVFLFTVVFAFQIPHLEIDTSAEGLMVEKDPARAYYDQVKKKFGSDNLTIVLLKADDVFAERVVRAVKRMSEALERADGVNP